MIDFKGIYHSNFRGYQELTMSSIIKHTFGESLKGKADTVLWEEAQDIVRCLEREKSNPNSEYHWKNAAYYAEFVRRDKIGAYFNAHNKVMFSIGKDRSAIQM